MFPPVPESSGTHDSICVILLLAICQEIAAFCRINQCTSVRTIKTTWISCICYYRLGKSRTRHYTLKKAVIRGLLDRTNATKTWIFLRSSLIFALRVTKKIHSRHNLIRLSFLNVPIKHFFARDEKSCRCCEKRLASILVFYEEQTNNAACANSHKILVHVKDGQE